MKKEYSVKNAILLLLFLFSSVLVAAAWMYMISLGKKANRKELETVSSITSARLEGLTDVMTESAASIQHMAAYLPLRVLSEDSSEWYFYYQDLQSTLNVLESSQFQSARIYYFAYNFRQDYFLKSSLHPINVYEEEDLKAYLASLEDFPSYIWQMQVFRGTGYYLYGFRQGDFYAGVFLSSDTIWRRFASEAPIETLYAVVGTEDAYLTASEPLQGLDEEDHKRLLSGSGTLRLKNGSYHLQHFPGKYGFDIISATKVKNLFSSLMSESPFPYLMLALLFLFVPVLYRFLNKELIKPLNYLRFGFSRVREGDLSFRAQPMFSGEFNELILSFNSMLRQIRELKVSYYEEKLLQEQAENRYLRTISYPHFLLNNLNLINNFAYSGNEEGIHEAVMNLSGYLRYFITADASAHTLRNDVQSARCYLNLNQLAYPGQVFYTFEVDETLLDLHFPPLIISTIVENCIKHGLVPGRELHIDLKLVRSVEEGCEYLLFQSRNNGPAFPDAVLAMVDDPGAADTATTHIGLLSVKQTLHALAADGDPFRIKNEADGVLVTIKVPLSSIQAQAAPDSGMLTQLQQPHERSAGGSHDNTDR